MYSEWLTDDALLTIEGWARDGLSDIQIAKNMSIGERTFYEWMARFPQFAQAIKNGKAPVDIQVENALLKRALGYECEEVQEEIEETPTGKYDANGKPIMKRKKHIRKYRRQIPGDTTAMIFWLKNRKPAQWRDKPEPPVSTEALQRLDEVLDKIDGVI